ncbi:uncharacterized protein PV09_03114 [Verruconis gallopava]|uniref:Alpha-L-rhamnosidase six-hairpin glycosidase domain-containing protein n=1 Tax=Verruconis gallopava TaxID=253628 RepID=A0A0D1XT82_9PEZI|nr:uncharacterized protein PV09_03114 [Verruconis gallopava]KIW05921.1 hypothetical protein PV09_03114 [Verruconis gallopava]
MSSPTSGKSWIWHPDWMESNEVSAGAFVHFRKSITLHERPTSPIYIQISADTRYKLYINDCLVSSGPVKGDQHMWFYDELDIEPYLRLGCNYFSIRVLRFYYASQYATSFPRLPYAGLFICNVGDHSRLGINLQSDATWETAIDTSTILPVNNAEDEFLHIFETVDKRNDLKLMWVPARVLKFPSSHGLSTPWKLTQRMIDTLDRKPSYFEELHNISSKVCKEHWQRILLRQGNVEHDAILRLPAGTVHHVELGCKNHLTASLTFRFSRPTSGGSKIRITYSECYEDTPEYVPYLRCKSNRRDITKKLIGPADEYIFGGMSSASASLHYHKNEKEQEHFSPFHFRTLRYIALDIHVDPSSDLIMHGIDLVETHYPLQVLAQFNVGDNGQATLYHELFETSVRTLRNCMHDCYEDCPFYEQLQYAMDVRSSAIFTYCISGDDKLARQAIIQLHNSFSPSIGLTASRAPSHQTQIIPHFSLFWICMVVDHFLYFNDVEFSRQFLPVCCAIFETFARRIDPALGLIRTSDPEVPQWDFVDWTESWRPMGIPPAALHTGYQTYTNSLYAYSLKLFATLLKAMGQNGTAESYQTRAGSTVMAIKKYCFNGQYFTDGLAAIKGSYNDLSQTNQVWAVLCGATSGTQGRQILHDCLTSEKFAPASTAMSFYVLRAMSMVGGRVYNQHFHSFWEPWRKQLSLGMTTWLEDTVSQRSDCHAWGSAPLYEFLAEVAGVRPRLPGWQAVTFQPRVSLFSQLDAMIPLCTKDGATVAHVRWVKDGDLVRLSFFLKTMGSAKSSTIHLHVVLPDGQRQISDVSTGELLEFSVSQRKMQDIETLWVSGSNDVVEEGRNGHSFVS